MKEVLEKIEERCKEMLSLIKSLKKAPLTNQIAHHHKKSYIFIRKGDFWEVWFKNEYIFIEHQNGLSYTRHLIANQGKRFNPFELDLAVSLRDNPIPTELNNEEIEDIKSILISKPDEYVKYKKSGNKFAEEDMKIINILKEALDKALNEAHQAMNNNDKEKMEEKMKEAELYASELRELKKNNKPYSRGIYIAKKDKIRRAINRAIKHIKKLNQGLGLHLDLSIYRSDPFHYSPENPIQWQTD